MMLLMFGVLIIIQQLMTQIKLRSSIGIGVDWYTPIGPLSFSLAQPLSKKSSDKTESFRFNLGTTF